MLTREIRQRVQETVEDCYVRAENYYGRSFVRPSIVFKKSGKTAGTANHREQELDFNANLLHKNEDDFIARTVPHEVAHLIDHAVNPDNFKSSVTMDRYGRMRRTKRDLHGRDFQFIMTNVLGCDDATRCHKYTTPGHVYVCDHGRTMSLGPKQHPRQQAGAKYSPKGHRCNTFAYVGWNDGEVTNEEFVKGKSPVVQLPTSTPRWTPRPTYVPTSIAANSAPTMTKISLGRSNKDIARDVYSQHPDRGSFIAELTNIGIKTTTASTYHHNFKSGKWS